MRRREIREFTEACLARAGARLEPAGQDLLRVDLPEALDDGPRERWLAFHPNARRERPEAELMAIGSAFLDRLVGWSRDVGRYAVAHRPAPARSRAPARLPALPEVEGRQWGSPVAASRPLFLFVFLVEYHTIDVPDDVVLIPFDPARGEALASPGSLLAALRGGTGEPAPGWPALPALPTAGDLQRVLDVLDRRLQRRARHVKEASALEIARETANIEAYYRQLIDEARHPLGRSVGGASDEGARVRLLQLDWKRRVQEVSRFWEARGDVRLSALGVVMEPAWVVPLLRRGARLRRGSPGRPYALVAGGRHGGLRCAVCGARLGRRAALHGTDLICLGHDGAPPAAAQA